MKKWKLMTSLLIAGTVLIGTCSPAFAYTKEETVYTKLDSYGKETITIVSEHLQNNNNEKTLEDMTTLSNIMNVNGNEKFTQDGEKIKWDSQGNDIYYQGTTNKELPITMDISYKFNGKSCKVEDMLGKDGKVEIHIQYKNHVKKDGLYVPFVVMSGLVLPTDQNSKVTVTNGKVTSNGSKHIVIAMAAPGLAEDFNNKDLKDLEEVTIQYETKKFELKSMMNVATPSLLSDLDMNIFDKMDDGFSLTDQLFSSYKDIENGGKELNKGMNEFSSKYSQFNEGVQTLDSQSQVLGKGVQTIHQGIKQLNGGLNQLNVGLHQISQNSNQLRAGASQLSSQILATVNQQFKEAGLNLVVDEKNYHEKIDAQISALTQQKVGYEKQLAGLKAQYNQLNSLPEEQKQAYQQQIEQLHQGIVQLETGIAQLEGAIPQLKAAQSTLDSIYTFQTGVNAYTQGVDQAANSMIDIQKGSTQLLDGSQQLLTGINKVLAGTGKLAESSTMIKEATDELRKGSEKLSSGLTEFNEKGLSKIQRVINEDLKGNTKKAKKLIQMANDYNTFTKASDGTEAKTKFIMIINSKSK